MYYSTILLAGFAAVSSAAPPASLSKARQAQTASERLGLTWLGGNSSLPKVLYEIADTVTMQQLILVVYSIREAQSLAARYMEHLTIHNMVNFRLPESKS
jgi:hypothetical protein